VGASFESLYVEGKTDVATAYERACSDALHEHGYDSYNGSISTTRGVTPLFSTPVPIEHARLLYRSMAADKRMGKWGQAGAIPIAESSAGVLKTVRFSINTISALPGDISKEAETSALRDLSIGSYLTKVSVIDTRPVWVSSVLTQDSEPVISYHVRSGNKTHGIFLIKEQALAAAASLVEENVRRLAEHPDRRLMNEIEVVPVCTVDGSVLDNVAKFTPVLESCGSLCEAEILTWDQEPAVSGWMFYFWAAV
jgi:hypothetical protein